MSTENAWPVLAAVPNPHDFLPEKSLNGQVQPGVYLLYDLDGTVSYVGQSCDVARRLDEHRGTKPRYLQLFETAAKDFHRAVWWPCADPHDRLRIEGILILALTPRYNRALSLRITPGRVSQADFKTPSVGKGTRKGVAARHRRRGKADRSVPADAVRDPDR